MIKKLLAMSFVAAFGILPAVAPPPLRASLADVRAHLTAFQELADQYGNRAAGTPGYDAALEYVKSQLDDSGIPSHVESVEYNRWEINQNRLERIGSDPETAFSLPARGAPATPTGGVEGDLAAPATGAGCVASDWDGVDPGFIALIELDRAQCDPATQAAAASQRGAVAAITYLPVDGVSPIDIDPKQATIPMIAGQGTTMQQWRDLLDIEDVQVVVESDTVEVPVKTANLIADLGVEEGEDYAMFGAHLDSVRGGSGINDNASGVAALLATAKALAADDTLPPTRIAFWGGEEDGLEGSQSFVGSLTDAQLDAITEYSNFDMVGSPNFIINARPGGAEETGGPTERLRDYFDRVGQAHVAEGPFGGSDFTPFANAGVPTLDYSSGAGGIKTAEQAALFGGTAGAPYDANYHQPGDDLTNIRDEAIEVLLPALAELMRTR